MSEPTSKPIRSEGLYVSYLVRKGLNYAASKEHDQTGDALAELVLMEWLNQEHPEIMKHLKGQYDTDKQFRDSIKPKVKF